jgi:phosphoglycolate phosphatase
MLIILDLDGTLLDSHEQHLNSFVKALKRTGVKVDKEMIKTMKLSFGRSGFELLKNALPDTSDVIINAIRKTAMHILLEEEIEYITLLPFAHTFLKKQTKEHEFVLATSGTNEFVYKILDKYDIRKYFKLIVTNDDVSKPKPNPEMLLKILEETGYDKSDALFIGDSIFDYEMARNAEVRFVGVTQGSYYADVLVKKAECVRNLEELEL